MQTFVRMTKLTNIVGRSDYISNKQRQEHIVAQSSAVNWKEYQDFERKNRKSDKANNEGRELIVALPNEWADLEEHKLTEHVNKISRAVLGEHEYQWAVHWNKAHTNLHAHIIFSERKRQAPKNKGEVWDRDIYLTNDGKIARRKADRATDKNGNVKPPVHKKGELKGEIKFSVKDKKFLSAEWLEQTKQAVTGYFTECGIKLDEAPVIPQFHEGKSAKADKIRERNGLIKEINRKLAINQPFGAKVHYTPEFVSYFKQRLIYSLNNQMSVSHLDYLTNVPKLAEIKTNIYGNADILAVFKALLKENNISFYEDSSRKEFVIHGNDIQAVQELYRASKWRYEEQQKPKALTRKEIDSIVDLRDKYVIYHHINSCLSQREYSEKAKLKYNNAQEVIKNCKESLNQWKEIRQQMQDTFNPLKKLKLKREYEEYAFIAYNKALCVCDVLGVPKFYMSKELRTDTVTEEFVQAILGYTVSEMNLLEKKKQAEADTNAFISKLKACNVTEQDEIQAYNELNNACINVFDEDCLKVADALKQQYTVKLSEVSYNFRSYDIIKPILQQLEARIPVSEEATEVKTPVAQLQNEEIEDDFVPSM